MNQLFLHANKYQQTFGYPQISLVIVIRLIVLTVTNYHSNLPLSCFQQPLLFAQIFTVKMNESEHHNPLATIEDRLCLPSLTRYHSLWFWSFPIFLDI